MEHRRIAFSSAQEVVSWNRLPRRDLLREESENQTPGGFAVSDLCSTLAGMSWMRGLIALLAVCVVLVTGSVSCGASGAREHKDGQSVSPVGKVLDDTDEEGRHYREVDKDHAPGVGIEVQPNSDDSWSVRLTVENFTFSPARTKAKAVSGRGVAVVFVDDRPVTTLRAPSCRLAAAYVPQGTHKVTARLYADDGTVWAVDGDPVESTADVTASKPQPSPNGALDPQAGGSVGGGSEWRSGARARGGASGPALAVGTSGGAWEVPAGGSAGGASGSQAGGSAGVGSEPQAAREVGGASGSRLAMSTSGRGWEVRVMALAGGSALGALGGASGGGAASGSPFALSGRGDASEAQVMASAGSGVPGPEGPVSGGGVASGWPLAVRASGGAWEVRAMARVGGGVPYPEGGVSADGAATDARLATNAGGGR
jgi:hypothetical protein